MSRWGERRMVRCRDCGVEFKTLSGTAKRCELCRPEATRERLARGYARRKASKARGLLDGKEDASPQGERVTVRRPR